MHRFWPTVIQPIMTILRPKVIVEVGCKEGLHTSRLLEFAKQTGAFLHVVDPCPELDVATFEEQGAGHFQFHQSLSLNALASIEKPDVVLLGGDHNWYTVFHELKLIEQRFLKLGESFPLVLLHDVGWPYGRRDLYYNPDTIPAVYRKPYAKKGLRVGAAELQETGGINGHLNNAIYENSLQNGVLTALEDFVAQTTLPLEFLIVPGLHGLGILYQRSLAADCPAFQALVESLRLAPPVRSHVEVLERLRLEATIESTELKSRVRSLKEQLALTCQQLREAQAKAQQSDGLLAKVQELTETLRQQETALIERGEEVAALSAELERYKRLVDGSLAAREEELKNLKEAVCKYELELQREKERCAELTAELRRETNKREKASKELEILRDQIRVASRDLEKLVNWLTRVDTGVSAVLTSRTWRVGRSLSKLKSAIMLRPEGRGATEYLNELLDQFRKWHAARQLSGAPPQGGKELSSRTAHAATSGNAKRESVVRRISVVIPVYNAFEETVACIESVLKHTTYPYRLFLLDDCSPDPRIWPMLQSYAAAHRHVVAVKNERNMGWTGTVNRGAELAEQDDVVLLNSDTLVTARWLEKLVDAACSRTNVGTVTPLSNAAGAFSVPENNTANHLPPGMSVDDMARLVETLSHKIRPSVPTGNGFCMYVTRAAWSAAGGMDQDKFPMGYGAENDFCMRVSAAGFVHLIDDATFIFHKNSASFQARKNPLLEESKARLRTLHPTYKRLVTEWLANDPLTPFREEIKRAIANWFVPDAKGRKTVLYVVHDGGGGTIHTNGDLMSIVAESHRCLLLKTGLDRWELLEHVDGRLVPRLTQRFSTPWAVDQPLCGDRRQFVRDLCSRYKVELVHIRHTLANGPELVKEIKALNLPIVFSFHDFYTVCPTIQLLDDAGRFCGGICPQGERDCSVSSKWFKEIPRLKGSYVYVWRERVAEALRLCDVFVTTSESAKALITEHYPFLADKPFHVIEHGRDLTAYRPCATPATRSPFKVVFFGALNRAKGTHLVEALMRINQEQGGPFEFHILGATSRDFNPHRYGGIVHGPYDREDLPKKLAEIAPTFSIIPSIWPETYCHALTESWAAGIPVLVSDIGVLRERVQRHGGGWCLDYTSPEQWYKRMVEIATTPGEWERRRDEVQAMSFPSVRDMAVKYLSIYRALLQARLPGGEQPSEACRAQ